MKQMWLETSKQAEAINEPNTQNTRQEQNGVRWESPNQASRTLPNGKIITAKTFASANSTESVTPLAVQLNN